MPDVIAVGTDHAGIELKNRIAEWLTKEGYTVEDMGAYSPDPCDYPDIAIAVGEAVADGRVDAGVLVCGSGIGISIAANKVTGVRAALCTSEESARLSRSHNDANVLVLAGRDATAADPLGIVGTWLTTPFSEEERHARRIDKIHRYEDGKEACCP
ncbi:MAG: ribose 5-phosphate isomerase B [Planctomycetota bacterium]|jgi:ribose 5-phosphate isomerase B